MDNNTIDPATIVRPSPKDGLGSTRVTSDNLSTEVKPRKVDGSEGLNSKYEVPSTNALMAEKRLAASNNLEMIRERLDEIAETLNVKCKTGRETYSSRWTKLRIVSWLPFWIRNLAI